GCASRIPRATSSWSTAWVSTMWPRTFSADKGSILVIYAHRPSLDWRPRPKLEAAPASQPARPRRHRGNIAAPLEFCRIGARDAEPRDGAPHRATSPDPAARTQHASGCSRLRARPPRASALGSSADLGARDDRASLAWV